jgi:hypothetical protein
MKKDKIVLSYVALRMKEGLSVYDGMDSCGGKLFTDLVSFRYF